MIEESLADATIIFSCGRKGKVISTSFTKNPETTKPVDAEFFTVVTTEIVGTTKKPKRHGFSGSYGGVEKQAIIFGKYIE